MIGPDLQSLDGPLGGNGMGCLNLVRPETTSWPSSFFCFLSAKA